MHPTVIRTGCGIQFTAWALAIQSTTFAPYTFWFGLWFSLGFWFGLWSVFPILCCDSHAVNGGSGITPRAVVAWTTTPLTILSWFWFTNLSFKFSIRLLAHVYHTPISTSYILNSVFSHQLQSLPIFIFLTISWFGHPVWNWVDWRVFFCPLGPFLLCVLKNSGDCSICIANVPLPTSEFEDVQLTHAMGLGWCKWNYRSSLSHTPSCYCHITGGIPYPCDKSNCQWVQRTNRMCYIWNKLTDRLQRLSFATLWFNWVTLSRCRIRHLIL